eukprot:503970_1
MSNNNLGEWVESMDDTQLKGVVKYFINNNSGNNNYNNNSGNNNHNNNDTCLPQSAVPKVNKKRKYVYTKTTQKETILYNAAFVKYIQSVCSKNMHIIHKLSDQNNLFNKFNVQYKPRPNANTNSIKYISKFLCVDCPQFCDDPYQNHYYCNYYSVHNISRTYFKTS